MMISAIFFFFFFFAWLSCVCSRRDAANPSIAKGMSTSNLLPPARSATARRKTSPLRRPGHRPRPSRPLAQHRPGHWRRHRRLNHLRDSNWQWPACSWRTYCSRRDSAVRRTTMSALQTSAIPTASSSASCGAGASSGNARRRPSCRRSTSSRARLRAALPESPPPTIVHGDYRLDNTMLAPDDPGRRRRGARLGDVDARRPARRSRPVPALLGPGRRAGDRNRRGDRPGEGLPHARAGDRPRTPTATGTTLDSLEWYEAFAAYKLAIIVAGIHARYLMGKTLGEGFDTMGEMIARLARVRARAHATSSIAAFEADRSARRCRGADAASYCPARARESDDGRDGRHQGASRSPSTGFVPSAAAILADWGADVVKVERADRRPAARRSWARASSPTPATSTSSSSSSTATSAASRSTCAPTTAAPRSTGSSSGPTSSSPTSCPPRARSCASSPKTCGP